MYDQPNLADEIKRIYPGVTHYRLRMCYNRWYLNLYPDKSLDDMRYSVGPFKDIVVCETLAEISKLIDGDKG